jgi:hypothetical protein
MSQDSEAWDWAGNQGCCGVDEMKYLLITLLLTGCVHQNPIEVSPEAAHAIARMVQCEKVEKTSDDRKECE